MATIPPFFLDCVVAIGNQDDTQQVSWVASGFFYGSESEEPDGGWGETGRQYRLWLVTNRHVVESLANPIVRVDSDNGSQALEIPIVSQWTDGQVEWINHPDPDVDVAVTPLNISFLQGLGAKLKFFTQTLSAAKLTEMRDLGMFEGQNGFLLGFPMSLVSGPTNAVIVRQACIARIRDAYEGNSKSFLFDGAVFPGNSGGAAIVVPESIAITGTTALNSAFLVGVVASYVAYREVAISQQTKMPRMIFEENSGLTNIFPVDTIDETIVHAMSIARELASQASAPSPEVVVPSNGVND